MANQNPALRIFLWQTALYVTHRYRTQSDLVSPQHWTPRVREKCVAMQISDPRNHARVGRQLARISIAEFGDIVTQVLKTPVTTGEAEALLKAIKSIWEQSL